MAKYSELYEKMLDETAKKMCPECGGKMKATDSTVLICGECQCSIDIVDYKAEYLEMLEDEYGLE